jgi:hypothetical protein
MLLLQEVEVEVEVEVWEDLECLLVPDVNVVADDTNKEVVTVNTIIIFQIHLLIP